MSEITGRDLIVNGVDEACKLLKELTETPGLYSLEFKFTHCGYDPVPTINYRVCKYAGYPEKDVKLKIVDDESRKAWEKVFDDFHE